MSFRGWRPYVPVHKRRANAQRKMQQLARQGRLITPVEISGRTIVHTFWGKAWCDHLEKFSDYANRLPRGRTYVRNGSVCHLEIQPGRIEAIVSGSELYEIAITIKPLSATKWKQLRKACSGEVGSMLELLQGKLSNHVMEVVTHREHGLFPSPSEIEMECSCPDWADMCKHLAAVLYGVGARLDEQPELLFKLRGVDHRELIAAADLKLPATPSSSGRRRLANDQLSGIFGVELGTGTGAESAPPGAAGGKRAPAKRSAPVASRTGTAKRASAKRSEPVTTPTGTVKQASAKTSKPVTARTGAAKQASAKASKPVTARTGAVKQASAKREAPAAPRTSKQASAKRATPVTARTSTAKQASAKRSQPVAERTSVVKPANTTLRQTRGGTAHSSATAQTGRRGSFIPTAEAVAALRQRLGLNKSQFAQLIGVSPPTIGNWERREGLLLPAAEVLAQLQILANRAPKAAAGRGRKRS